MDILQLAKRSGLFLAIVLASVLLVECARNTSGTNVSDKPVMLSKLLWCSNKPDGMFVDDAVLVTAQATSVSSSVSTPGPVKGTSISWSVFKANLGFPIFLPETLPEGSCLLKPFGWVRNATSHNSFIITYVLPDRNSLTIAQTLQSGPNTPFQCFVSPEPLDVKGGTPTAESSTKLAPVQLCSGVRDKTNITFSARWTPKQMQQFFNDLQTGIDWTPTS
jgi:hypothetical protein